MTEMRTEDRLEDREEGVEEEGGRGGRGGRGRRGGGGEGGGERGEGEEEDKKAEKGEEVEGHGLPSLRRLSTRSWHSSERGEEDGLLDSAHGYVSYALYYVTFHPANFSNDDFTERLGIV
jgi:hypothetical protein